MEPSDELRDLLLGFYDALANGDVAFMENHFSRDAAVRGIGTDPQE
jgi:ketosteroid isomerase-like protein